MKFNRYFFKILIGINCFVAGMDFVEIVYMGQHGLNIWMWCSLSIALLIGIND